METGSVADCFSSSYSEARRKFVAAAGAAGADMESLRHPSAGPAGEPLFVDVALLGSRDSQTVLVLVSGTHGIEGFAGSAIQTCLMREGAPSTLREDSSILMIHAINPFGFAHLRRTDEDNVDPNRNFLDHSKPHPRNPAYDALANFIAPRSALSLSRALVWPRLLWYKARGRAQELQQAISGGQYAHPDGLFYGGESESWSNKTLQSIVRKHLAGAARVVAIDLHTGLGAYGDYQIILQQPEGSAVYRRAVAMWGPEKVRTTCADRSRSDGADDESFSAALSGPAKLVFSNMLPDAEVTAATVDFGTVSVIRVFLAMRDENWLHHHGDPSTRRGRRMKAALQRAFCPADDGWRRMVWSSARHLVRQAIENGL